MSDRGIPRSFRHMHGFGSHTFSFINAANERHWVKFSFKTKQGIRNLSDETAGQLIAGDRESAQRDLFDAIERGEFPRWTLYVQVLSEAQARALPYNPFDLTKVWLHEDAPLTEVGVLELNRNPENYFAEVEQAAFTPANVVPGIDFSPDRMLQARLFSYGDAQRYRLGVNFNHIPVNAPKCPFHSYHRDGAMRVDGNAGGVPAIVPNSRGDWADHPQLHEPSLALDGAAAHWDHRLDDDYFSQPGRLFRLMSEAQQQVLFENTARAIHGASDEVRERHIGNCTQADPAYGAGVRGRSRRCWRPAPTGSEGRVAGSWTTRLYDCVSTGAGHTGSCERTGWMTNAGYLRGIKFIPRNHPLFSPPVPRSPSCPSPCPPPCSPPP
ncbi:catalase domain-containing protein [Ditylenchus destructor]|nr:catalase domain-containing protein [Ditylenchus destructor]